MSDLDQRLPTMRIVGNLSEMPKDWILRLGDEHPIQSDYLVTGINITCDAGEEPKCFVTYTRNLLPAEWPRPWQRRSV